MGTALSSSINISLLRVVSLVHCVIKKFRAVVAICRNIFCETSLSKHPGFNTDDTLNPAFITQHFLLGRVF